MTLRKTTAATMLMIGLALPAHPALSEDTFTLTPGHNARRVLVHFNGKEVTLQLASGKEITGTVTTVGEHLVQLSRLSGREFYDAAVDYDHIEAVLVRVRSK